jgi:hypothetical protein
MTSYVLETEDAWDVEEEVRVVQEREGERLSAVEFHRWLGYLKRQRLEVAHWIGAIGRTNLLIGSKTVWIKAYLLARGRYQRELFMGFRRFDGAGGAQWLEKGGKKLDLRHLRKQSIASLGARLRAERLISAEGIEGRQCALRCQRTCFGIPGELSRAITWLERNPTASGLGMALGFLWKAREEAAISRSIRLVPEPWWILEAEKIRHAERNTQKREWKRRNRELGSGAVKPQERGSGTVKPQERTRSEEGM